MRLRTALRLQLIAVLAAAGIVLADDTDHRPAAGIQDDSFLVEEAYNQEAGVVQHILDIRLDIDRLSEPDHKDWHYEFTQEWPVFSQRHQLSYTVPYEYEKDDDGDVHGVGDVLLNYRFQALFEGDTRPAFAPRFSVILPTGDRSEGLGDDTLGYQFNLPFSKIVQDRWTVHANAGLTFSPDLNGRTPVDYKLGASAIYALTPDFNLLLETTDEWKERVGSGGRIHHDFEAVISPGFRCALNFQVGQLVLGAAVPVGLSEDAADYGAFFYFSFEHRFMR